jgi:hypothetical protein
MGEENMLMVEKKTIFNASFEESKLINVNLFSEKRPLHYDLGLSDSNKLYQRLFLIIPLLFFSGLSYGLGIGLPETANMATGSIREVWSGTQYFQWLKFPIILVIIIFSTVILINVFPKKNYMIQRIFGITNGLLLIFLMNLSIMPMLLGTTLGATGWIGFSTICIYGIFFFLSSVQSRIRKIKQEMYGDELEVNPNYIFKIWSVLKKIWLIPFALIIINIFIFRIGMWGDFSFWSFVWLFAGPIYFGIVTLFIYVSLKMFVNSFYFAKYAEQYRILWKVTDEQWYGKRKAQKIAKKK